MITISIFWALVLVLFASNVEQPNERKMIAMHTKYQKKSRKWFRARPRWHDRMLVLNMSIFNSGSSWNRIFNPVPQRENVWC
jgi:hypothetical protein